MLHAYEGLACATGMFDLSASLENGSLLLSVSDQGRGIGAPSTNRGLGLGLRLALQLAGGVQTRDGGDGAGRTSRCASRCRSSIAGHRRLEVACSRA